MNFVNRQISISDAQRISAQLKTDLIENLYAGNITGIITGFISGIATFFVLHKSHHTYMLPTWFVIFNFLLMSMAMLHIFYKTHKSAFSMLGWKIAFSLILIAFSISWGGISYFIFGSGNLSGSQYLALIFLFAVSAAYAIGTVGESFLCFIAVNLILTPSLIWCFLIGGFFYNSLGVYIIIFLVFLLGINDKSTRWLKDSLKLKLENTLVTHQANHDLLTGLPNERSIPQYIATAIQTAKESKEMFCVICFSLNRIELVSDSLGYEACNLITESVANRIKTVSEKIFKESHGKMQFITTLSRKDTFTILLVPVQLEKIEEKSKLIFSVLDAPFYLMKKEFKFTASMGISVYPRDGEEVESLLANADAAMIQAKQAGGNRLEFYRKEINEHTFQQLELEKDLHDALKRNEFVLYYQPLVSLKTGHVCGMEALIRWQHPKRGFISPLQFIPLAEETGLIISIGEWVLKTACEQMVLWQKQGFSSLKMAVNLASKQLQQEDILLIIDNILNVTKLDPKFLELEITETAVLNERVIPVIKEFKNKGISLAIDDFGTGYSGLSYLQRFSVSKLKIDRSFIQDITTNNDSATIVSATLAMARELHVETLAEGVETKEQLQFLKDKGCDTIQGYYFGKPVPAADFTKLLTDKRCLSLDDLCIK